MLRSTVSTSSIVNSRRYVGRLQALEAIDHGELTSAELSLAIGRPNVVHAAASEGGASRRIAEEAVAPQALPAQGRPRAGLPDIGNSQHRTCMMRDERNHRQDAARCGARKPLSLKRTVDPATCAKSFSHGRSKSVVVEKKKKRTMRQWPATPKVPRAGGGRGSLLAEIVHADDRRPVDRRARRAPPRARGREASAPRRQSASARVCEALAPARSSPSLTSRRSPARRRRRAGERSKPKRPAAEAAVEPSRARRRKRKAAEAPRAAEQVARAHRPRSSRSSPRSRRNRAARRRAPSRRRARSRSAEERRERIKLTINNAFDEAQRERSLASLRRKREREKLRQAGVAAAARQGHARGDHPGGDHHPGTRQPHDGALRRRHQAADGAGRDAQDQRRRSTPTRPS